MNDKVIVGENGCDMLKRNYSKMALLSALLEGKEVVTIPDASKEYKTVCDSLGIEPTQKE